MASDTLSVKRAMLAKCNVTIQIPGEKQTYLFPGQRLVEVSPSFPWKQDSVSNISSDSALVTVPSERMHQPEDLHTLLARLQVGEP
jgi:hypothetical protein